MKLELRAPGKRVQWASGSSMWTYHGIGKVHIMGEYGHTLCGRRPKWHNAWPGTDAEVESHGLCARCRARSVDSPARGT